MKITNYLKKNFIRDFKTSWFIKKMTFRLYIGLRLGLSSACWNYFWFWTCVEAAHGSFFEYDRKIKRIFLHWCLSLQEFFNNNATDELSKVQSQIDGVKEVMVQNIEKVLECGEKIELLVDKTDRLNHLWKPISVSGVIDCF